MIDDEVADPAWGEADIEGLLDVVRIHLSSLSGSQSFPIGKLLEEKMKSDQSHTILSLWTAVENLARV